MFIKAQHVMLLTIIGSIPQKKKKKVIQILCFQKLKNDAATTLKGKE